MMQVSYNFICIPVDTHDPETTSNNFGLRIVSEIRFASGVSHAPAAIADALARHPLLGQPAGSPIKVLIWDFDSWTANHRSMNPALAVKATIKYSGEAPVDRVLNNLINYMGKANQPIVPTKLKHASRHETLDDDHFVDINKAADHLRSVTHSLKVRALQNVEAAKSSKAQSRARPQASVALGNLSQPNLENTSFRLTKWLDSAIHSSLLQVFNETVPANREKLFRAFNAQGTAFQNVTEAIRKISRRLKVDSPPKCPLSEATQLKAVGQTGAAEKVDVGDPNVAVHSAMKNPLMAESCGFVTRWLVESPQAIFGKRDYVIQLDTSSFVYDHAKIDIDQGAPTAFRRLGQTHPLAFTDIGRPDTTNCLLAYLTDKSGEARYRASCVNSEAGLVKHTILQTGNSLAGPGANAADDFGHFDSPLDDRPPQVLKHEQFGSPEPETSGVVFSAPGDDLVVPSGLKFPSDDQRRAAMPCLFLEDLWAGYRLDLKREDRSQFSSTHLQEQTITLTQSGETLSGWMEDFIEREQLDDPSVGHSSTDLVTYVGLSSGQMKDYQKLLGNKEPSVSSAGQLFRAVTGSYGKTERLLFQQVYDYRFRLVLLGGVSCDCSDPELASDRFQGQYRQKFPFFRARALRPGEILISLPDQPEETEKGSRTIYLTSEHPHALVVLVPSPIDLDTSRFSGLLLAGKDEPNTLQGRKHVADVGKFFKEIPPSELNYFYDSDVFGVVIRAKVLNGDEQREPEDLLYSDGTYCRLVEHVELQGVTEKYGDASDWKAFKPIVISLRISSHKKAEIARKGWWGHSRHVEVQVPPAAQVQLSFVPLFDAGLLTKTASYMASSAELLGQASVARGAEAFIVPAVAEEKINVIHAVSSPRENPILSCFNPKLTPNGESADAICMAERDLDSQFATFVGRVEVDAASTKEVRLEASWMDVADSANQEKYLLQSGKAAMPARSVVFEEFEPVRPSAVNFHSLFLSGTTDQLSSALLNYRVEGESQHGFTDQFDLQCIENKVFFNRTGEPSTAKSTSNRFDAKDLRRKLVKLEAVGVCRFVDKFVNKSSNAEVRSNTMVVDVPSTVRMGAPQISHVVPLRAEDSVGTEASGMRRPVFGLRIYVRKPFFESGFGERLAIGCCTAEDSNTGNTEVQKYVTQWGEDPIERAGLSLTLRTPRASDFESPAEETVDGVHLDEVLYPADVSGGRAMVIYRDGLDLAARDSKNPKRSLSVASYALQYDDRQRLWYADVRIRGEFFGWCGMALYRHQPGALLGRELSETSAWVYAAILYGEPVAWVERDGNLHLTIGPVHDPYVTFELDSLAYQDGVSRNLIGLQRDNQLLKSYVVDKAKYFEAVLPSKNFGWGLLKKRFGFAVASSGVRQ